MTIGMVLVYRYEREGGVNRWKVYVEGYRAVEKSGRWKKERNMACKSQERAK